MVPYEKHSWKRTVPVKHTFLGSWVCPLARASTSSIPFLKPNDINTITCTSLQCTSFYLCKIYYFNDLIHRKDKPLKRWQLSWFTVVTVCCMAPFSHNDCVINLSTCTWMNIIGLHHIHLSFFLMHIKTSNQTIYILESNNSTYKQYFVTNVSLNKER